MFCDPSTIDVFLDFSSGNIDGLAMTKHTVSLVSKIVLNVDYLHHDEIFLNTSQFT